MLDKKPETIDPFPERELNFLGFSREGLKETIEMVRLARWQEALQQQN